MATAGVPLPTEGERLVMEMEFVQCLANPAYLACTIILWVPLRGARGGEEDMLI